MLYFSVCCISVRILLFSFFFFLFINTEAKQPAKKPNILFILSDDHAVNAIGCYNKRLSKYVRTPNIDKLASEGMLFTKTFCTNSICSPSRATILTGKYSHKNGVYGLNQTFDSTQTTLASVLKAAGYQTAVYGKWHLVSRPVCFDDYAVLDEQGQYNDPEFFEKGSTGMIKRKGWVDDIAEGMAEDFIRRRDKSKPFMVMLNYKSVHDPWDSRPPHDTGYQTIQIPEPSSLCDTTYAGMGAASLLTTLKLESIDQRTYRHKVLGTTDTCAERRFVYQQYIKSFLRGANTLDENVGKILAFLKAEGLDENTIVIYSSDQGHFLGEHGFFSKRFMYEESMQMPLIIRYAPLVNAGSTNSELVSNVDFAPSLLDMAGVKIPKEMQGESIKPLLQQKKITNRYDGIYYHYYEHMLWRKVPGHYGIRTNRYKLIYFYGLNLGQTNLPPTAPEWELYDLEKDQEELHNVYNDTAYKKIIANLKQQLLKLKKQYDDDDSQYPELVEVNKKYFWN